ncbi:hypothetical protein [Arthrobacter sp. FW306-2-2C-D06B]|uniref:hypothetical protein n=1 Tax=Arthrobacter sp. FW306-2-2C-D06B TaxID=2879618 RepID=UPI001F168EB5|nr:hypothetical protein [Arthrobacter sp. FW306-2-2C-D06B]UKA60552.1 hypothetical protein LFT47_09585 [Arthrobacter sp. FW306-2-2C-D06B]
MNRRGVAVIPRSNIKAVTLHDVDSFGEHGDGGPDVISFTVDADGHEPIVIPMPRYNHALSGDHSRLFDALLDDLATKGTGRLCPVSSSSRVWIGSTSRALAAEASHRRCFH